MFSNFIQSARSRNGTFAFWEQRADSCWFGICTPFSMATNSLPGETCPIDKFDGEGVARLLPIFWESLKQLSGPSIAELMRKGGDTEKHFQAMIDLAEVFGVNLVP